MGGPSGCWRGLTLRCWAARSWLAPAREYLDQLIRPIGAEGLDRRGPAGSCRLFLGPGLRLGARWNRLVETVRTRKEREKTGGKWARHGLRSVAGRELTKDQLVRIFVFSPSLAAEARLRRRGGVADGFLHRASAGRARAAGPREVDARRRPLRPRADPLHFPRFRVFVQGKQWCE